MIRRLVGGVLAAAMLQLNIARADVVCADHAHRTPEAAPMEHAQSGHHHMSATSTPVAQTAASERNCDTPAQRDCCQALVSCSILLGSGDAVHGAAPATDHAAVIVGAFSRPTSRSSAPEPPPPKA